ncbi:hypothetical protein OCK74_04200 [Chitinophagaceae bacterium LB-8]|uniref:Uncharacterized protein n=1 Tax=Paraflavisolibacter caeni TaxID=2982496 RepID=A0A9X3B6N7_9BACT|nr:hypothetical protein [Paraflavisolibacter caeni]MCU7548300.1 hypothetical protein [Paraflavisolibacter caeni]
MNQVYINSKERVVIKDGKKMPRLLLGMIRGSIGKCFVVKHYRGNKKKKWKKRIVITKYPDMSGVVASEKQRVRRDLFKEAVVYAQWILADTERKEAFRKTLPRKKRKHVYQAAIRLYMSRQGDKQWLRIQLAVRGMMSTGRKELVDVKGMNGLEQMGPWQICWKKEVVGLEVVEVYGKQDGGLEVLRI